MSKDALKRKDHYLIKLIMPHETRYKVVHPPSKTDKKTIDKYLRKEAALFDDKERPRGVSATDAQIKFKATDLTKYRMIAVYAKDGVRRKRETVFEVATALPEHEQKANIEKEAFDLKRDCILRDHLSKEEARGILFKYKKDNLDPSLEQDKKLDRSIGMEL
ncbi:hypothetical protein DSCO28_72890 (plasmid) [Desulfosarcina ovata subsp. sediminis]|uniref:Uncharacterized protein n=1 Tax=Desulfosarcina ovata subsp. sediminis TaxID=885957 RepID=A0A5K8A2E6_9BACT|nr:hypothetical protein DSCO28_72890 [Desulfosarcina ovata subsp. sediminis]